MGLCQLLQSDCIRRLRQNYECQSTGGTEDYITPFLSKEMTVVLKKEDMSKLSNEVVLSEDVSAPVEKGQKLGAVVLSLDGEKQCEIPLTSPIRVEKLSFKDVVLRLFSALNNPY